MMTMLMMTMTMFLLDCQAAVQVTVVVVCWGSASAVQRRRGGAPCARSRPCESSSSRSCESTASSCCDWSHTTRAASRRPNWPRNCGITGMTDVTYSRTSSTKLRRRRRRTLTTRAPRSNDESVSRTTDCFIAYLLTIYHGDHGCWPADTCLEHSMTNCSSQRHLAANRNRSQEGSSGCRNIIRWVNKRCDLNEFMRLI